MQYMHDLGQTLDQGYKIRSQIELYANHKISIPGVTTFNAVTAPHYSHVGDCGVDRMINTLDYQTPKNLLWEDIPYGCSC